MTGSDLFIFRELHQFSSQSPVFNHFMHVIAGMDFLACGVVVAVLWYYWFRDNDNIIETRKKVINTLVSSFIVMVIARALTRVLPFTLRPILHPELETLFPFEEAANNMNSSNSMPSDHAVLYLAIATGIFLISKKAGVLSFIYLFLTGLFPRVYLGLHFPTDIYVGGLLGVLITLTYSHLKIRHIVNKKILRFSSSHPGLFYALFFLIAAQMATMFGTSRQLLQFVASTIKQII